MEPSIRVLFFTILILSTFVFAGCPNKELPPTPPPEPVMESAPEEEEDY